MRGLDLEHAFAVGRRVHPAGRSDAGVLLQDVELRGLGAFDVERHCLSNEGCDWPRNLHSGSEAGGEWDESTAGSYDIPSFAFEGAEPLAATPKRAERRIL
jgi:hypothetical protein